MRREEEQQKTGHFGWLYGITAGACVAAMQIGMGTFQMEREYAVIYGGGAGASCLFADCDLRKYDGMASPSASPV